MKRKQPIMPQHRLNSFVYTVCARYRKNMTIESAVNDVIDDFPDITTNAAARIRNAAIKELKKNGDWRYPR